MKRVMVLGLVVFFTVVPGILADVVTLVGGSGYGLYQTGIGGEFTLLPDAGLSYVLNYYNSNPLTQTRDIATNNTFQTFCVEVNENIAAYNTYDTTLTQGSIYTGVPLTLGAAWLYSQFASGILANYDYTRGGTRPLVQELQNAIWYFMGQAAYDPLNQYIQLADTNFVTDAAALLPSAGAYNVAVLNLWAPGQVNTQAGRRQDMLVIVPEPSSLALLTLGVGALAFLPRKRR
jgi:hypothetical protein